MIIKINWRKKLEPKHLAGYVSHGNHIWGTPSYPPLVHPSQPQRK